MERSIRMSKILAAVDFSGVSMNTAKFAHQLCSKTGASLHLAHVLEEAPLDLYGGAGMYRLESRWFSAAEKRLTAFAGKLGRRVKVSTEVVRAFGGVAAALTRGAIRERADWIVLATRGRGGVQRFLLGSVAERVVRTSSVPVLTVRNPPRFVRLRRILVPVDFSPNSVRSVRYALAMAKRFRSEVELLHVIDVAALPLYGKGAFTGSLVACGEKLMAKLLRRLSIRFAPATKIVSNSKSPAKEICKEARRWRADCIILFTHARSGYDRFMMGSEAEQVLRNSPCPVLTLR
jgi:nucleotide-binding universal stress UspA family protein